MKLKPATAFPETIHSFDIVSSHPLDWKRCQSWNTFQTKKKMSNIKGKNEKYFHIVLTTQFPVPSSTISSSSFGFPAHVHAVSSSCRHSFQLMSTPAHVEVSSSCRHGFQQIIFEPKLSEIWTDWIWIPESIQTPLPFRELQLHNPRTEFQDFTANRSFLHRFSAWIINRETRWNLAFHFKPRFLI